MLQISIMKVNKGYNKQIKHISLNKRTFRNLTT